jgi:hypothetical protein
MKLNLQASLRNFAFVIAAALTFGSGLPKASAITVTVKNLNDSGTNSLRAAITAINSSSDSSNTINFQAGLNGNLNLNSALPTIANSVSINGPSAEKISINGKNGGVFTVEAGIVDISGLTLVGKGTDAGAVVRNSAFAVLTINECVISGKRPGNQTGLINEVGGTTFVISSSIVWNDNRGCGTNGGGIRNSGTLSLINSTLAENNAVKGGAIYNTADGTVSLTNCTLADNYASSGNAGGIFNESGGTATLGNTIVARNKAGSASRDVSGPFQSSGGNLIGNTTGSTGFGGTDLINIPNSSLKLAANVADNGGPTLTIALLTGSPAINAGINALAVDQNGEALDFDQRGAPFTRINGGQVDVGAFESAAPAPLENARAYKRRALKTISDCLSNNNVTGKDECNLKWAAWRIAASLQKSLWIDGNHLTTYGGLFVFEREKQAVWYLSKVTTGACATAAQSAIADLVEADRRIADAALTAAMATPCANLDQAIAKYNAGLQATDAYAAIEYYRWSWWHSQQCLNRSCAYDDDEEDYEYHHWD